MLFDTDVIVWAWRRNPGAVNAVNGAKSRAISVVTSMELLQGAGDKREARAIKLSLLQLGMRVLPLAENIGTRALAYIDEYSLSDGLELADALIAATAIEANEPLISANYRHFRCIKGLTLEVLKV
jgi:predicted nucleic acid-binding protein